MNKIHEVKRYPISPPMHFLKDLQPGQVGITYKGDYILRPAQNSIANLQSSVKVMGVYLETGHTYSGIEGDFGPELKSILPAGTVLSLELGQ